MRIAFVTEVWKPSINGVVTRLSVTIDELIAAGHEVLVIAPTVDQRGDVSDAEARPGLQVRRMPSVRIRFIYGGQPWGLPLRRMQRMLAAFDPDLVHVVAPALLGLGAVRAAKRLRVPLVASFHTDIAGYAKFYHLGFLVPFIWWWLRRLHNAAAINLVTSSYSARLLAEHGIQHVVHWQRGVDVQLFDPARRTRGREGGAGAAAAAGAEGAAGSAAGEGAAADASALPLALYVGRLAWEKGLQRLETLVRSGSVQLEVIGDGPDRERLERIFDGTPTRFLGAVTGVELAVAYANADLFAFPSTTETLGLVLLEAFASGLPIVAAESPASRELLAASPAARLFPADRPELAVRAVHELLASGTREELGRIARNGVTGWDWASATAGLIDEYHAVLVEHASVERPDAALGVGA